MNTNPLPIIPLETCSSVLWRGAPGLIGYESLTENETLTGLHIEDMYTLELVYQGLQEIHLDGIWRSVPPSHIVWTSPQAVHAHRLFVGLESLFVAFPKELVEQVYRELSNNSPPQVPHAMILPCPPQLQDMLSHLLHEMQGHQSPPDYIIRLLLQLISAEFLRSAASVVSPIPAISAPLTVRAAQSEAVCSAIRLVEAEHHCASLSLEGIAHTVGLSYFHFSRRFKHETGMSPGHFLRLQRLNHALQLLFTTALPLEDIAYQSGFGSGRRLTEACKAIFGRLPSQLRMSQGFFYLSSSSASSLPSDEREAAHRESPIS